MILAIIGRGFYGNYDVYMSQGQVSLRSCWN